jgi:hypothetical protein
LWQRLGFKGKVKADLERDRSMLGSERLMRMLTAVVVESIVMDGRGVRWVYRNDADLG